MKIGLLKGQIIQAIKLKTKRCFGVPRGVNLAHIYATLNSFVFGSCCKILGR